MTQVRTLSRPSMADSMKYAFASGSIGQSTAGRKSMYSDHHPIHFTRQYKLSTVPFFFHFIFFYTNNNPRRHFR